MIKRFLEIFVAYFSGIWKGRPGRAKELLEKEKSFLWRNFSTESTREGRKEEGKRENEGKRKVIAYI